MKFLIFILFSLGINAEPLTLLKEEWFGKCRGIVNEAGEVINKNSSLQSSYIFNEKTGLIWKVASFHDAKCGKLKDANRYTFKCDDKTTLCTQTNREFTQDGKKWVVEKMVDYTGHPSISKMFVSLKKKKKNLEITTTSYETEEPETEVLRRN